MSRTGLWILTIVFLPIAGIMGLVTYIELHAGHELSTAFYVILAVVWYLFLLCFFSAATRETSLPNRILTYPWHLLGSGLSSISPKIYSGALVLGVLVLLGYWAFWMPVDHIVLIENYSCTVGGPKPTTLWPGIIVLFIGYVSLNHLVHGEAYVYYRNTDEYDLSQEKKSAQNLLKWSVRSIAVILSIVALYRLGSLSLFTTTAKSIGNVAISLTFTVAAIGFIVLLMFFFYGYKQKRIDKQVMQDIALIPIAERESIVKAVDQSARNYEHVLIHCRFVVPAKESNLVLTSHFGGVPYLENIAEFPVNSEKNTKQLDFLLQLQLSADFLGEIWQGRLITVYLDEDDWSVSVRSYSSPSLDKYVAIPGYKEKYRTLTFSPLAVPYIAEPKYKVESDYKESYEYEHIYGFEAERLIQDTPGIHEKLQKYTKHEIAVLTYLIDPQFGYRELDIDGLILEGGDPVIIQNPHDAVCPVCNKKMRFLFQIGEVSPELQLGDAGQVYVYGCDDHPEHCEGFFDCF